MQGGFGMNRKLLITLFIMALFATNVSASRFKFIFSQQTVPAFTEKKDSIYCDTTEHWCNYPAERLYNEGIFTGIKIGENYYFMPDEYITRGEFLLYLNAVLKIPDTKNIKLPFTDEHSIPKWQYSTICSMYENGFIHGNTENGKTYFNYDEKISRLECAIILNNILGLNNTADSTKYYDNYIIPKYAVTPIKNVTDYGLMQGYEDNSFRPYLKINRAMLANILCMVKDYVKSNK